MVMSNDLATAHVRHDFHGIVETKQSYQFDQTLYRVGGSGLACETTLLEQSLKSVKHHANIMWEHRAI